MFLFAAELYSSRLPCSLTAHLWIYPRSPNSTEINSSLHLGSWDLFIYFLHCYFFILQKILISSQSRPNEWSFIGSCSSWAEFIFWNLNLSNWIVWCHSRKLCKICLHVNDFLTKKTITILKFSIKLGFDRKNAGQFLVRSHCSLTLLEVTCY